MASIGAKLTQYEAIPTLEVYRGVVHTTTAMGTSALPLPATNLSNRKGIFIQNLHATQTVQIGSSLPNLIIGNPGKREWGSVYAPNLEWQLAAAGTAEWYCKTKGAATSGVGTTAYTFLFYTIKGTDAWGTETLAPKETVGSLSHEHDWGWGNDPTAAFATIYIKTGGETAAYNPLLVYDKIVAYTCVVTSGTAGTATDGFQLKTGESIWMTLDGTARLFAIASGATTPVVTLELI